MIISFRKKIEKNNNNWKFCIFTIRLLCVFPNDTEQTKQKKMRSESHWLFKFLFLKQRNKMHLNNVFRKWTKWLHFHFWPLDALSCSSTMLPSKKSQAPNLRSSVLHKEWNKFSICFDKLFVNVAFNLRFLKLL